MMLRRVGRRWLTGAHLWPRPGTPVGTLATTSCVPAAMIPLHLGGVNLALEGGPRADNRAVPCRPTEPGTASTAGRTSRPGTASAGTAGPPAGRPTPPAPLLRRRRRLRTRAGHPKH